MQQESTPGLVLRQPRDWASKPRKGIPNKYVVDKSLPEAYKDYMKQVDPGTKYDIDWATYKAICKAVVMEMLHAILYEAAEIKLDAGLGTIRIRKDRRNPHNPQIDYEMSKKLNKVVFHTNLHSRGYYYRTKWHKWGSRVVNKRYYSFEPNRKNFKRKIKPAILAGMDYFE